MCQIPDDIAYETVKKSRHWFLTKNNPEESLQEFFDFGR